MSTPKDINIYFNAVEMGKGLGLEIVRRAECFQINLTDKVGTKCIGNVTTVDSLLSFMEGYREGVYNKKS
jgi:hypothetical protein